MKAKVTSVIVVALLTVTMALIAMTVPPTVSAAEAVEATPEIQVVQISVAAAAPTATPMPSPTPQEIVFTSHELNETDVDWLARLAFLSPLYDITYKAALLWQVLNRVDSPDFPNTIQLVIGQKGEYGFWDEKKFIKPENLEANKKLARLVLNQWLSEKEGMNAGRPVPKTALFIKFTGESNRNLELLAERGGDPLYYPIRGAYEY